MSQSASAEWDLSVALMIPEIFGRPAGVSEQEFAPIVTRAVAKALAGRLAGSATPQDLQLLAALDRWAAGDLT